MNIAAFLKDIHEYLGDYLQREGYVHEPQYTEDRRLLKAQIFRKNCIFMMFLEDRRNLGAHLYMGQAESETLPKTWAHIASLLPEHCIELLEKMPTDTSRHLIDISRALGSKGQDLESAVMRGGCNRTTWFTFDFSEWD